MGILSIQQAERIAVKQRPSKRIYITPQKQEKEFTKIKVFNSNRMVFCKVCYKRIGASEAVEVIGGSEQGHKTFWMCRKHM